MLGGLSVFTSHDWALGRQRNQDQSDGTDGSSVERKRKRSAAVAAAAASGTAASSEDDVRNPGSVAMQGTGVKGAPVAGDDPWNGANQAKKVRLKESTALAISLSRSFVDNSFGFVLPNLPEILHYCYGSLQCFDS